MLLMCHANTCNCRLLIIDTVWKLFSLSTALSHAPECIPALATCWVILNPVLGSKFGLAVVSEKLEAVLMPCIPCSTTSWARCTSALPRSWSLTNRKGWKLECAVGWMQQKTFPFLKLYSDRERCTRPDHFDWHTCTPAHSCNPPVIQTCSSRSVQNVMPVQVSACVRAWWNPFLLTTLVKSGYLSCCYLTSLSVETSHINKVFPPTERPHTGVLFGIVFRTIWCNCVKISGN